MRQPFRGCNLKNQNKTSILCLTATIVIAQIVSPAQLLACRCSPSACHASVSVRGQGDCCSAVTKQPAATEACACCGHGGQKPSEPNERASACGCADQAPPPATPPTSPEQREQHDVQWIVIATTSTASSSQVSAHQAFARTHSPVFRPDHFAQILYDVWRT